MSVTAITGKTAPLCRVSTSARCWQIWTSRFPLGRDFRFRSEQTVQLEGDALQPEGEELRRYQETYFSVWTDGPARLCWPRLVHLVVRPRWIRYSDFDLRPPLIVEFTSRNGILARDLSRF